jgi:hypothetical protein
VSTINVGYYGLLELNAHNHAICVEGDHLKMCGYPRTGIKMTNSVKHVTIGIIKFMNKEMSKI